jgi:serine/threonine-protein kinase
MDETTDLAALAVTGPAAAHTDGARFASGTMIAGRFRVVSTLGAGGMAEVYRVDDTRLAQTVALKFLPAAVSHEQDRLQRLNAEVRLARQIAHPNICRLYDIGEWNGRHFLSMEYVDGEDLARLLHRIGRLSADKALDLALGLTAGLAAAHARNVLHRDLKPGPTQLTRVVVLGLALAAFRAALGGRSPFAAPLPDEA